MATAMPVLTGFGLTYPTGAVKYPAIHNEGVAKRLDLWNERGGELPVPLKAEGLRALRPALLLGVDPSQQQDHPE